MAKRKIASAVDAAVAADGAIATPAMRLPMMSAESALGPPSRQYRSLMSSALTGTGGVVASQMGDEGDADEDAGEGADDGAEATTDESDDVTGDAGDDEDGGDDEEDAASGA